MLVPDVMAHVLGNTPLSLAAPVAGRKASFSPAQIAGLKLWLKADAITGLGDGDAISTWPDSSGQGNDATGVTTTRPLYKTSTINGKPVARFDGADDVLTFANFASSFTAIEGFIVGKIVADPPPAQLSSGLWRFTTNSTRTNFPYTDGIIYDDFGSNGRKTTVNPTPSLTSAFLYAAKSVSGEWTSRLNGVQIFTTATNTVSVGTAPTLGKSDATAFYKGDIAEFLIYNVALTTTQRGQIEAYLNTKYALY